MLARKHFVVGLVRLASFALFLVLGLTGCASSMVSSKEELQSLGENEGIAQSDPLSQLVGNWNLTVFVFGGGQFIGPTCPSPVTIAPPRDSGVSFAVACDDGSTYAFLLKHDAAAHAYLITVKSKHGISVDEFPLAYVEGLGWKGAREQLVDDREVSITATVQRIEGRNWYGWGIDVLPTADIERRLEDIKRPYFRADFTRRK